MKRTIDELQQKSAAFHRKLNDRELDEYLRSLAQTLEEADTMQHHFGYLLKHVRSTVAHPVRPKHLREAIDRAERYLKRFEEVVG